MKRLVTNILLSGLCLTAVASAFGAETLDSGTKSSWQMNGRSASYVDWRRTNGEAPGTATNDGEFYREELNLSINRTFKDKQLGLDMSGRFTNDDSVDASRERLQYLRGFYETETINAEFGDVAGSFTPYVFTSALKGGKVSWNEQKRTGWQAAIIGGVQKASWDELSGTTTSEQPDRWVGALYSSYTFDAAQTASLSIATTRDDMTSGDYQTVDPQGAKAVNVGGSVDWRFNRYFTSKVDIAYMEGTENMRDDVPEKSGLATKIKLYTKPLPRSLRSNFTYEYVDTDFHPLVGSGAADRERFENSTSYYFNRQLKFRLGLKHSRDNLNGALGDTQKINDGTLSCDYRPDFLKRGDVGVRTQIKTLVGRGSDLLQQEVELNFNIRPKPGWRYGAAYVLTDIDDNVAGGTDQLINSLRGTFGWNKRFNDDNLLRSTVNLDYRYLSDTNGDQDSVGGSIDIGYDGGRLWSADILAQTKLSYRDISDDTSYSAYQIRATYHPGEDASKSVQLTAEERQYKSDSITSDQTYSEDRIEISYLFSF